MASPFHSPFLQPPLLDSPPDPPSQVATVLSPPTTASKSYCNALRQSQKHGFTSSLSREALKLPQNPRFPPPFSRTGLNQLKNPNSPLS